MLLKKALIRTLVGIAFVSISLGGFAAVPQAWAAYPDKPITMIVAYSPGGGTDTVARLIAKHAEKYLGQTLVVENKPGAGGQIGFTALSKARKDGYTIGFVNLPSIFMIRMLRPGVGYTMDQFQPIANFQLDPVIVAVREDSPFETLADMIAYAKDNPGKLNVGGDGPQSNNQLQILMAAEATGIEVNYVSYSGSGPARKAVLGKEVDVAVPSASSTMSLINDGKLRVLAVFSKIRYEFLPDVPTFTEASGVEVAPIGASARGIAAPKGIAADQVIFLQSAFARTFEDEAFQKQAKEMGLPLLFLNAEDFSSYIVCAEAGTAKHIDLLK